MKDNFYLVLAGGVGAAKFIDGLSHIVDQSHLKIIINTGDDIELYGLNICPDIDIITYTLASLVDREKGWGFIDESFDCLNALKKFYEYSWFNLGDKDLATHIFRTDLFKSNHTKAEITSTIAEKLGIRAHLMPMCNEPVETHITTNLGEMHFEEFYIKHKSKLEVFDITFKGLNRARMIKGMKNYIKKAEKILIAPSNPIVSIGTIINVKGMRKELKKYKSKIYAISPIIQGSPVKGPADLFLMNRGFEASCVGVARFYQDIVGHFIIDIRDELRKDEIVKYHMNVYCFDTLMTNLEAKKALADFVINEI
jgi:LPPG:FO 2-phospho-L-lactate transferase